MKFRNTSGGTLHVPLLDAVIEPGGIVDCDEDVLAGHPDFQPVEGGPDAPAEQEESE